MVKDLIAETETIKKHKPREFWKRKAWVNDQE